MIRVTIELVPHGNEFLKKTLGEISIINDGTGTEKKGNYYVRAFDLESGLGKEFNIKSFTRKSLFWNLVGKTFEILNKEV